MATVQPLHAHTWRIAQLLSDQTQLILLGCRWRVGLHEMSGQGHPQAGPPGTASSARAHNKLVPLPLNGS